jgi:hypothetical protein
VVGWSFTHLIGFSNSQTTHFSVLAQGCHGLVVGGNVTVSYKQASPKELFLGSFKKKERNFLDRKIKGSLAQKITGHIP